MRLTCNQCGKVMFVPQSKGHLKYCSVKCWQDSGKLDVALMEKLARRYKTKKAVAELMEIPYATFTAKIRKQGLYERWKEWTR